MSQLLSIQNSDLGASIMVSLNVVIVINFIIAKIKTEPSQVLSPLKALASYSSRTILSQDTNVMEGGVYISNY